MMKPYAFHSLVTALLHAQYGIESIAAEWNVQPLKKFSTDTERTKEILLQLASAHEGKDLNGRYGTYVWGCMSTTDRKLRRTARVAAVLRALGAQVPDQIDANLS
jgi:hypothetical protein